MGSCTAQQVLEAFCLLVALRHWKDWWACDRIILHLRSDSVAALELARTLKGPATVVAVMPDSGVKYLSKIFNDEWMDKKGYKNYNS